MKKNIIKYIFFIFALYMFIFQDLLENYIPFAKYFDESFALLLIPTLIYKIKKGYRPKLKSTTTKQILLLIAIIAIGLYSNIVYNYQSRIFVAQDIIAFIKFPMAYWLCNLIFDSNFIRRYKKKISLHVNILTYFLFILTILNYIFKLFPYTIRYGLMANQLFYSHSTKIVMIAVLLYTLNLLTREKGNLVTIIIFFLIGSTLRAKGFGFCLAAAIIASYINYTNSKISTKKYLAIGIVCFILTFSQISLYFFNNTDTPRQILTENSVLLANEYAPVGTGFATYGSAASVGNYSPVYRELGMDSLFGFSEDNYFYMFDSFWPIVLGQLGYLGITLYILFIVGFYKDIQKSDISNPLNKKIYIAKMVCFTYFIISSTSETAFVNPMAPSLMLAMGINSSGDNNNKDK